MLCVVFLFVTTSSPQLAQQSEAASISAASNEQLVKTQAQALDDARRRTNHLEEDLAGARAALETATRQADDYSQRLAEANAQLNDVRSWVGRGCGVGSDQPKGGVLCLTHCVFGLDACALDWAPQMRDKLSHEQGEKSSQQSIAQERNRMVATLEEEVASLRAQLHDAEAHAQSDSTALDRTTADLTQVRPRVCE